MPEVENCSTKQEVTENLNLAGTLSRILKKPYEEKQIKMLTVFKL